MNNPNKKRDKSLLVIGGMTLIGIGRCGARIFREIPSRRTGDGSPFLFTILKPFICTMSLT